MKYKVTEKHPYLKDCSIQIYDQDSYYIEYDVDNDFYSELMPWVLPKEWIECGWIEEIEEPEFTKADMLNFNNWCGSGYAVLEDLEDWIKKYKS